MSAAALPSLWLGPYVHEAVAAYHRARAEGLSPVRALVLGNIASFRDGWAFRRTLAAKVGASVRTVARALLQGREAGLVGVARAKQGERPTAADGTQLTPIPCGWSHRWTIGWGKAGDAVKAAVANARAKFQARRVVKGKDVSTPAPRAPRRQWTAAEIDAELERRYRSKPPPEREPPG